MKKLFIISGMMLIGLSTYAQNRNAKASIEVDGVCLMCKVRIEKAAIKTKGVKSANWNVITHELQLIYNEKKTNLRSIQENIAAVGHDTQVVKATDEAYNSVDPCCMYRDEKVVKDHQN
jgi:cation transport ATPase